MRIHRNEPVSPTVSTKPSASSARMRNPYASARNDDDDAPKNRRGSLHIVNGRFQLQKQASVRFRGGDTSWQRNPSSRNLMIDQQKESYRNLLKEDNSNGRSVSFATGTIMGDDSKAKKRGSSRGSGLDDMDASWGGVLGMPMSSSSSDDDDDHSEGEDSLGDLVPDMDESKVFRAKAQQSMSFNMSFVNVGLSDDDDDFDAMNASRGDMNASSARCSSRRRPSKRTGRGSIFVIADAKFGQTQVVQTKLEKSAIKLQVFFRRCLLILRQYRDDFQCLKDEFEDIESRRLEELEDVKKYMKEEKEQFRMQLEEEYNEGLMTPEEWESYHKEKDETQQAIDLLKGENKQLKKDCKELLHTNNQLAIVDPEREAETRSLEIQIQKLELDKRDWRNIKDTYEAAVVEANRKLEVLTENQRIKRKHHKRMERAINRVVELLEESKSEENIKLLEKVEKLKSKREKKMKKLKAKTAKEQEGRIPMAAPSKDDEGNDQQEEQAARRARRKSSRRQKQSSQEDVPELDEAKSAEKPDSKERRKSKKVGSENGSSQCAQDVDEKAAKKKKKKDKKDKDKKEKKKDKSKSQDENTPKIYEKAAQKKPSKKMTMLGCGNGDSGAAPGALMALITG